MRTKVTVFERIDGLCLNEKFAVEEVIFTVSSAKVVCPHLDYFRNEKNIQPVRWYKVRMLCFVLSSNCPLFKIRITDIYELEEKN